MRIEINGSLWILKGAEEGIDFPDTNKHSGYMQMKTNGYAKKFLSTGMYR